MFEEYLKLGHKKFMLEAEKTLLVQALEKCGWNITKAAIMVKLNRTTLVMKLQRLKIKEGAKK